MREKNLEEIRPATKGVKIAAPRPAALPPQQSRPRVVKDVAPVPEEIPNPSEEATKVVIQHKRAYEELTGAIKGVNRLMNRQVLPENRSVKDNDEEHSAIAALVNAAMEMERISPGEGLLGMAILAVRQGLSLRDAGNRLACELDQIRREVKVLQAAYSQGKNDG
jgi:hypothetical protein